MQIKDILIEALAEDIGNGDHTTLAIFDLPEKGSAKLIVKDNGVIAGIEIAKMILDHVNPNFEINIFMNDGDACSKGDIAFEIHGEIKHILTCERLILNVMQRMSGIATQTRKAVNLIEHTRCKLLDTRKTTPLLRILEKQAVLLGGGYNHRFGLYDMIMIKDNHIDYAGSITNAINKIKSYLLKNKLQLPIEVEARNIDEVKEILTHSDIHRIMLDNFSPTQIKDALTIINNAVETEASGGITMDTLKTYAETGVDYISVGFLTHSVKSLDLSLKAS